MSIVMVGPQGKGWISRLALLVVLAGTLANTPPLKALPTEAVLVHPTEVFADSSQDIPKELDPKDEYPQDICDSEEGLVNGEVRPLPASVSAGCAAGSISVSATRADPNTIVIAYSGSSTPDPDNDGFALYGHAGGSVHLDLTFATPGQVELTHIPSLSAGITGPASASIQLRTNFSYYCGYDTGCPVSLPPVEYVKIPAAGTERLRLDLGFYGGGAGTGEISLRFISDSDSDGLFDFWETDGIDINEDGEIDLDLPAMGANPLRKDIFIEVDWMAPLSLHPDAADIVMDAFANAPVANPDGSTGITLHIDNGPSSVMNPLTGALWGDLSRGTAIPFVSVLGSFGAGNNYDWTAVDALKADYFPAERWKVFHYVIVGDRYGSPDNSSSGISRGIIGSDFLVTLGSWSVPGGAVFDQAGTFMHELGHNLGLRHGGGNHLNNKPNFLSIMNYQFQLTGLYHNAATGLFDYSRFGASSLGQIRENQLAELNGLLAQPALLPYKTIYACIPAGQMSGTWELIDVVGAADWNCDGAFNAGTVQADINADGALTAMDTFDDWANLVYSGGSIGQLGAGASIPTLTPMIEPQLPKLLEAARVLAPFDLHLDGRVDLGDFAVLQRCFAADAGGPCLAADADADADIDLSDCTLFSAALDGPQRP